MSALARPPVMPARGRDLLGVDERLSAVDARTEARSSAKQEGGSRSTDPEW
jgi:hypothetical protein